MVPPFAIFFKNNCPFVGTPLKVVPEGMSSAGGEAFFVGVPWEAFLPALPEACCKAALKSFHLLFVVTSLIRAALPHARGPPDVSTARRGRRSEWAAGRPRQAERVGCCAHLDLLVRIDDRAAAFLCQLEEG